MEKNITWNQIHYEHTDNPQPCKRWGHKTVFIEDQLVLFGGFSDVTYLSDLWSYNIHTNQWTQIPTTGKKPQGKSNFTMHYDQVTNQLLVFGGGGPNKRRFNKISLLDWKTKEWTEYVNDNENSPWERTYHSSEFKYPYLITFGGEGAANLDFDDLWVFDVQKKQWREIKAGVEGNPDKKIEGRRFHSTALIGEQFFVIAGCRMNYTCIPTIYSIDLSPLFKSSKPLKPPHNQPQTTSDTEAQPLPPMLWHAHPIPSSQQHLIQKWGHSSQVYHNSIYLFGGRNRQDCNDLIEFNPTTNTLTKLNPTQNPLPKCRRRHSTCMIGSSMVVFGGFNVDYFSDLQYVSLWGCRGREEEEVGKYEVIWLEGEMFEHFMGEMAKDKPEYDIELLLQTPKTKQPYIIKSISTLLQQNSLYFHHSLAHNQSSNPQRKQLTLTLTNLAISPLTFQLFNIFLIKDLLILPKHCKLKRLCELLLCADYFLNKDLFQLVERVLVGKVDDGTERVDDLFNVAANFGLERLLKVCAERKVVERTYFTSHAKVACLTFKAAKLKEKHLHEILEQIRFDEIHMGRQRRVQSKSNNFGKNIRSRNLVAEQKGLVVPQTQSRRKKSFVEKFVESFSKFCGSTQETKLQERPQHHSSQSDDDQYTIQHLIKMF